jgi:hypothetical protein
LSWDREGIIWAAGLFEGEGCIKLHKVREHRQAYLEVTSTDFDTVERFAAVFDLKVSKPYDRAPWKSSYKVNTGRFETVQAMIVAMWPWLGQRRRARALEVLRGQTTTHGNGVEMCGNGHPRTPENLIPNSKGKCRLCQNARKRERRARLRMAA